jgi:hypothetical protein
MIDFCYSDQMPERNKGGKIYFDSWFQGFNSCSARLKHPGRRAWQRKVAHLIEDKRQR